MLPFYLSPVFQIANRYLPMVRLWLGKHWKLRREVTTCDEVKERAETVRAKLERIYDDNYRGTQRERNREYQYER